MCRKISQEFQLRGRKKDSAALCRVLHLNHNGFDKDRRQFSINNKNQCWFADQHWFFLCVDASGLHPERHEEPNRNDGYTDGAADFVRGNVADGFHRFRCGHWPFGDNKSQHCYTNSHHWLIAGHRTDENEEQTQRKAQEQMFDVWQCPTGGAVILRHAFVAAKCSAVGGFSATILTACRHPRALLSKSGGRRCLTNGCPSIIAKAPPIVNKKTDRILPVSAIIPPLCPRACRGCL